MGLNENIKKASSLRFNLVFSAGSFTEEGHQKGLRNPLHMLMLWWSCAGVIAVHEMLLLL